MSVRHSNKKRKNVARLLVSRFLQTVSRYESREKYRDTTMNRADTTRLVIGGFGETEGSIRAFRARRV